ncbi:NLRC3 protein [Phytophthora cinnamomi]|uniref:NLRC3 protein n=1 Tax=Phytophthora cinnamomi TaxID=4785 RepID=UPI00355A59A0|nr:NLRC3 protein [Phytophthora cinnamomi]
MSRWKDAGMKRGALRLPVKSSPVARRSQLSPLHSIPPRFRDVGEASSYTSDDDNDAVDTNLEEDLLMEIRTLVKKEKYLEQLENELRDYGGSSEGSDVDTSVNDHVSSRGGRMREDLYDDEDEMPLRRPNPKGEGRSVARSKSKVPGERDKLDTAPSKSLPARVSESNAIIAKKHFRACFVEVNPVQLREIRTLILANQDLQIHHLRTLSKNLFLFSSLKTVNLSNNQLDDSGSKEIRTISLLKIVGANLTKIRVVYAQGI